MFRPKNSNSPSHVVQWNCECTSDFQLYLSIRADELLEFEDDPDEVARQVGLRLFERGVTLSVPENRRHFLGILETDESLMDWLGVEGLTFPLVEASPAEKAEALDLDIWGWAGELAVGTKNFE